MNIRHTVGYGDMRCPSEGAGRSKATARIVKNHLYEYSDMVILGTTVMIIKLLKETNLNQEINNAYILFYKL